MMWKIACSTNEMVITTCQMTIRNLRGKRKVKQLANLIALMQPRRRLIFNILAT